MWRLIGQYNRHLAVCRILICATLTSLVSCSHAADPKADLVLLGEVFTSDVTKPWAKAIAIRDERIVLVGSVEGVGHFRGAKTDWIDYGDRLITPDFNDNYIHLFFGSESLDEVDLNDVSELTELQQRIEYYAKHNTDGWVVGSRWLYGAFPNGAPDKSYLDAVLPDRTAFNWGYDGHSAWVNSKALELAGISSETPDPPNARIARDPETGEPTGMLKEDSAMELVLSVIPSLSTEKRYKQLVRGIQLLNKNGITAAQDAGAGYDVSSFANDQLPLLIRLLSNGDLNIRLTVSLFMTEGNAEQTTQEVIRLRDEVSGSPFLKFGVIKTYVDGVIESQTAAMFKPYAHTEERGYLNWSEDELAAAVVDAESEGLQVYLHAIGERGVHTALNAYATSRQINGKRDSRGRIEHIETIRTEDYPRFAELGVVASMQPLHAEPNDNILSVYSDAIGPERAERAFGWRSLEEAGAVVTFGSDWSVVSPNVMHGLYTAITRQSREGLPEMGWHPDQRVSLEDALRHYTIDGAYGSFAEVDRGSLTVGKYADIAVLSRNPFDGDPKALLSTEVILTLLAGRVVYRAEISKAN